MEHSFTFNDRGCFKHYKFNNNAGVDAVFDLNYKDEFQKASSGHPFGKSGVRKLMKRRQVSPKMFPYKVRVTEDKVAKDLSLLQITPRKHQRLNRTFSEIESSIVDSDCEDDNDVTVEIAKEFKSEIDNFTRNILKKHSPKIEVGDARNNSKALVLWTPPKLSMNMNKLQDDDGEQSNTTMGGETNKLSMEIEHSTLNSFDKSNSLNVNRPSPPNRRLIEYDQYMYDDEMEL